MKLHWGHGIAMFYFLFVCTLVIVVIKSFGFDNSLVTEEYYLRDMNYQQEFERRSNSEHRGQPLLLQREGQGFRLQFPDDVGAASGSVLLYRPSSARHDRRLDLQLDTEGGMNLPVTGLPAGRYVAVVEWSAGGTEYYDEVDLYL